MPLSICPECSANSVLKTRGSNAAPQNAECSVHNPQRKKFPRGSGRVEANPFNKLIAWRGKH